MSRQAAPPSPSDDEALSTAARAAAGGPGPLVSILSTSYNHGRWLRDTIVSVACQTYPRIEHVIVDDGSDDSSLEILSAAADPRLRWAQTSRVGQARALNEAFLMSTGGIVGWLSSDDAYYTSDVVDRVVAAFERNPRAALVYGHAVLVDEHGLQLQTQWVPPLRVLSYELPMHILQPAAFVRRSAVGEQFVNESFDLAMDTELWLRLRDRHEFVRLDHILAAERHHPGRKSHVLETAADEEARVLDQLHKPAGGRAAHKRTRRWGVAFRLAGLLLVPQVIGRPRCFVGRLDSHWSLIWRQLIVPRARMAQPPPNRD